VNLARRGVTAFALASPAALLSGCALLPAPPQTAALRAAAPPGLPLRAERAQVPFFPQTPYHCGPAALATALADVGLPTTPEALADDVFLPSRGGSLQIEMLAAARRFGALAYRLPGRIDALLQEVAAGHAVVVLQNLGLEFAPRWHYAVLVGYDLPNEELVLRSGSTRREAMSLRTFEHTWARGGHWATAVLPPGRLPATVAQDSAEDAALGFERVAAPRAAATAWRALAQRWPASLIAALGLGNTLHAGGETEAAIATFDAAARRHDSAVAWNNLARLQLQQGRVALAQQAAARAVQRAETAEPTWRDAAQATAGAVAAAAQPAR
jgi:tetratricopeptide (TPR) repeat protein